MRRLPPVLLVLLAFLLAACAAPPSPSQVAKPDVDVLLLGEQHDAPEHQRLHLQTVQDLAARGRLTTLALEMAEQGHSTAALPRSADEAAVRQALGWMEQAWPWAPYGPVVMAAVRSGVPVVGANLPRARMRQAMADERLDTVLPKDALARHYTAVREGHCGLMPEARIAPMARIQIARDRAMADTVATAARPGGTVVLLAGSGHVDPELGVPQHLPRGLDVEPRIWPAEAPKKDYCAELRQQMQQMKPAQQTPPVQPAAKPGR